MRRIAVIGCLLLLLSWAVVDFRNRYQVPSNENTLQSFGSPQTEALEERFSVLVWNIHKGKKKNWRDDLDRLSVDTDLVLLQEAQLPQMADLFRQSPLTVWEYAVSFIYKDSNSSTGVATGSHAQPRATRYLRSPHREPIVGTPKMALISSFKIADSPQQLLVVNLHTHLATSAGKVRKQLQEIAEIIAEHEGPVIWAGDFNTWSKSRYKQLLKITKNLSLQPVSFLEDKRTKFMGEILDHAFVRGLRVDNARTFPRIESSDHVPFSADLKLIRFQE